MNKELANKINESLGEAYGIEELAGCIKWLSDLQLFYGDHKEINFYNGNDDTCGNWYAAKTISVLAEKIIKVAQTDFTRLNEALAE